MNSTLIAIAGAAGLMCAGAQARQEKSVDTLKKAQEARLAAQEALKKPTDKPAPQPAGAPSEEEMMKAWMAAASPNENHKRLNPFVGAWDVDVTSQVDPSKPAEHTKGETTQRWVLDGRFLLQEHSGSMMGTPFTGIGLWGYDNIDKQYVGIWADSMGTGYMNSTGQYDEKSKSWNMQGSFKDPTGQVIKSRQVFTLVSDDKHTFDFYMTGPDGKDFKSMTIVYTRKEPPKYEIKPIEIKPSQPAKK